MSFRLKTILGVGLIETVLLLTLILTSVGHMRDSTQAEFTRFVNVTAAMSTAALKDAVLSYDLATIQADVEELLKNDGVVYARVLDGRGNILAEAGKTALIPEPFYRDNSVAEVRDNVFDVEQLISTAGVTYGRLEIGFSTDKLAAAVNSVLSRTSFIALIELVAVALFSFALGYYLTRNLRFLLKGARSVSDGKLDYKVPVCGRDELSEVAQAFNVMIENLADTERSRKIYQQQLEALNQELEGRVERRTAELESKNAELQDINDQLHAAQDKLVHQEKMASLGQLAAGVAHEINNPLSFVSSNLVTLHNYKAIYQELVDDALAVSRGLEAGSSDEVKKSASHLQQRANAFDVHYISEDLDMLIEESLEGTRRVADIVSGLRLFSREGIDERDPYDLNQAIEKTLKIANNEIKYKCRVETELGELPLVHCNFGKISQVILNLVMNASQAIETDGVIRIRSGVADQQVFIQVSDNGPGITADNMKKLFDPFFTTKPVGQGTGLGLAVSHGIIEEHGGRISVESTEGEGATFTIWLPAFSEEAAA